MPSISNIDKFAKTLNSLGDEPNILKERGETLEKVKIPPKSPAAENPFLVNIEEESEDTVPDLAEGLDLFSDDDLLGMEEDFDDIPHLEEDEDFNIDEFKPTSEEAIEEISFDDITTEELPEEIDSGETPVEIEEPEGLLEGLDLGELSVEGEEPEELLEGLELGEISTEEEEQPEELSEGFDLGDLSAEEVESEELPKELSEGFDLEDLSVEGEEPEGLLEELDLEDISIGSDEAVISDLEELSDLDLDTTESLEDDLSIQDIALDDIGTEEPIEIPETEIEEPSVDLSIEDEVMEDDFGSLEDEEADEFSLVDFGDTFNLDEEESSSLLKLDEFTEESAEEEPQEEIKYTEEEFNSIKKTLMGLPLNVRIIIEEEIAENGLFGVKLEGLVSLLIDGASLKEIVKYLNKNLGHKVKISSSFEKLSALELEKRKKRFSYIFVNAVLPKVKWVAPVAIAASLLFLAGYFWGYKIFLSEDIYERGHELILIDKYEEAYDEFLLAFNTHRKMKWYYIYADTYVQRKSFDYAEIIYLQILNEDSSQNRAILSYSSMKGLLQGEYEKAANFLLGYIDKGRRDYYFMTLLGDIYMKWGAIDPSKYEDARLWYNEARNIYGNKPPILFKLLNYFIITDKFEEVKFQRRVFEISDDVKVDGDVYARMAGYLIDKGVVEDIRETIFRGLKDNARNPNLHYQLARYFTSIGDNVEGEKALRKAIFYYSYGGSLSKEELASLVDAKRLLGELYLNQERYLAAEDNYQEAVSLYENLHDRNLINEEEKYGEIYAGYGDIFYYGGNSLNTAYNLYTKAEENKYNSKELSYKKGYIKYLESDTEKALDEFHKAEDRREIIIPVLLSKANTLALRGSYSSALTYYDMLLNHLLKLEEEIVTLYPRENDLHLSIVENYIRIYNNRGVTLYNLYGDKALPEVGLNFTQSSENYDYLTRDPDFLIRSDSKDLAYYNSRALLFPDKDMDLLLYKNISKDFEDLNLGVVKRINYGANSDK